MWYEFQQQPLELIYRKSDIQICDYISHGVTLRALEELLLRNKPKFLYSVNFAILCGRGCAVSLRNLVQQVI